MLLYVYDHKTNCSVFQFFKSRRNLYQRFCNTLKGITLSELLQPCLPGLTGNGGIDGLKLSSSSRVAWSTLNNLAGRSRQSPRQCPVSVNAIASQLEKNGKYEGGNRETSRFVIQELSDCWRAAAPDAINISRDFSPREFAAALHYSKPGKAPGPASICPELLIHADPGLKSWLRGFLSSCLRQLKISKVWRRALVVAIPDTSKSVEDPQSYRLISLLCDPYKILERLICNRVEPIVD